MGLGQDSMDALAERARETDGGVFCPYAGIGCPESATRITEADPVTRALYGSCSLHGDFAVDVSMEFEDELRERHEDEPYQQPHDLL